MANYLFVVVFAGLPSPASETHGCIQDAAALPTVDRPFARYLSLYNIAPADRAKARMVADVWVNSLSRAKRTTKPVRVNETLLRLDARNYHWDTFSWDSIAKEKGFTFGPVWKDVSKTPFDNWNGVVPIMRIDEFLAYSSDHPYYSRFLGLPDTVQKTLDLFFIRLDDAKILSLDAYGSKLQSGVALHNRRLIRYPQLAGYWWESQDHLTSSGKDNVIENLQKTEHDAGEYIWSLPNGLQGYYIANGQGKQVPIVPAEIAQDYQTPARDKQIRSARSCVGCHSSGIIPFDDDVSSLIRSGRIDLRTYDRDQAARLEELYMTELAETIAEDQSRYRRAVQKVGDDTSENFAKEYVRLIVSYVESPVTPSMAAMELGVDEKKLELLAVPYQQEKVVLGTFAMILAGKSVPRDSWESVMHLAIPLMERIDHP